MKTSLHYIGLTEPEPDWEGHNPFLSSPPEMIRRAIVIKDPQGKTIMYPRIEPMTASGVFNPNQSLMPKITSHELKIVMIYED